MKRFVFTSLALMTIGANAHATPLFSINADQAYYTLLSTGTLTIAYGDPTSILVRGNVGAANDVGIGQNVIIMGRLETAANYDCGLDCGLSTGGVYKNSAQATASLNAWSTLAASLNSLTADHSVLGLTNQSWIFLPGVTDSGGLFFNNAGYVLTFDGQGDPNAQFVLRVSNQMTLGSNVRFDFINGANPQNLLILSSTLVNLTSTGSIRGSFYSGAYSLSSTVTSPTLTLVGGLNVTGGAIGGPRGGCSGAGHGGNDVGGGGWRDSGESGGAGRLLRSGGTGPCRRARTA